MHLPVAKTVDTWQWLQWNTDVCSIWNAWQQQRVHIHFHWLLGLQWVVTMIYYTLHCRMCVCLWWCQLTVNPSSGSGWVSVFKRGCHLSKLFACRKQNVFLLEVLNCPLYIVPVLVAVHLCVCACVFTFIDHQNVRELDLRYGVKQQLLKTLSCVMMFRLLTTCFLFLLFLRNANGWHVRWESDQNQVGLITVGCKWNHINSGEIRGKPGQALMIITD